MPCACPSGDDAARVDLLVCADGIGSSARRRLLPDVSPAYAGYAAWRGTVAEERMDDGTLAALADALVYQVIPESHILVYPIPNVDGATEPGRRLLNFVWYRNYPGAALDRLMTDREGVRRDTTLPPGTVDPVHVAEMRAFAMSNLAPPLAAVVLGADEPFVQAVFDIEVPRMAFGRTCLIGDAAFALRPHIAAGTAKAASDGWALAEALDAARWRRPGGVAELGGAAARRRTRRARPLPAERGAVASPRDVAARRPRAQLRVARPTAVIGGNDARRSDQTIWPTNSASCARFRVSNTAWHRSAYATMIESDVFQSCRGSGFNQ